MHDTDLTPDAYFAIDIGKVEDQPDGTVMVYGVPANPETLDNDDQIADAGWLQRELPAWFHSYANVREMHQPIAAGTATRLDWRDGKPQIAAHIVNPDSVTKVRHKVLKAFSVGVKKPETQYDPKAKGGRIVGGKIVEVSLVDRPSIPGSDIESFKAAVASGELLCKAVGAHEWLDTQSGVVLEDTLAGAAASLSTGGEMAEKSAGGDVEKRDMDPDVGGGVDRDKIPAEDFAGKDRSYPIVKPGDVSDAAQSIGRAGPDNYSSEQLRENIIRIARRKGDAFVAELPEAWKKEQGKAAAADDADKSVEASISAKEADPQMDTEKTVDAEAAKASETDAGKGAELEKAAAQEAFCAKCGGMQKIADGHEEQAGKQRMLVGKDAAGHELRKYLGKADGGDGDGEKTVDADAGKAAGSEADERHDEPEEKTVAADTGKDAAAGAGAADLEEAAAEKTVEAVAKIAELGGSDAFKAALGEVLADALGIDVGKVGRKMAAKRLDRFNKAVDELKSIAADLAEATGPDAEKAANSGGPSTVAGIDPARTRMVACLSEIQQLARAIAAGDGDFDLDVEGHDGHDMGVADEIRPKVRIDENEKTAAPDLTKALETATTSVMPELTKAVAAQVEEAFAPLVQRLAQVEHSVRPPSPPLLFEADRRHVLQGDTEKAAAAEKLQADLEKSLSGVPDQQREEILASVLASQRGWRQRG